MAQAIVSPEELAQFARALNHRESQLRRRQQTLQQARVALALCMAAAAATRGRGDCRTQQSAVATATARVREPEDQLKLIAGFTRDLTAAVTACRPEAQRLSALAEHDIPKARAFLTESVRHRAKYQAVGIGASTVGLAVSSLAALGHAAVTAAQRIAAPSIGGSTIDVIASSAAPSSHTGLYAVRVLSFRDVPLDDVDEPQFGPGEWEQADLAGMRHSF